MTTSTRVIKIPFKTGTTSQNDQYLGQSGEITIDRTKRSLRVHDGIRRGGEEILRRSDLAEVETLVTNANALLAPALEAVEILEVLVPQATQASTDATAAKNAAQSARDLAQRWATSATVVSDGVYGAKYYADASNIIYGNTVSARDAAQAAQGLAESAKTAAESAKTAAETASTVAGTAKTAAETASTVAGTAKTASETARDLAQRWATSTTVISGGLYGAKWYSDLANASSVSAGTAKTAAETAKTAAETAKGLAETASTAAGTAKTAAETAKGLAETARDVAQGSAATALTQANRAQGYADQMASGQVNADWNATDGKAQILNKPTIPTNTNQLTNGAGFVTATTAPVRTVAGKTGAVTLVKGDVGLGNVDNTSDANKPVSAATQTALNLKANASAVPTKTSDLTNDSGFITAAEVPPGGVTSIAGKGGVVTLADIGLGNVTNTSDANKPVSTAQQTALNLKAPLASPVFTGVPQGPSPAAGASTQQLTPASWVKTEINNAISVLTNSAPAGLNTFNEFALALGNDPYFASTMATALASKASLVGATFTGPVTVNGTFQSPGTFDINGSAPGGQTNGLYVTELGATQGTTLNPTYTAALMYQLSSDRSGGFAVDTAGYIYGFRSHSIAGTYTWQSKVKQADDAITLGGSHKQVGAGVDTIAQRDQYGDLTARYLRSTHPVTARNSDATFYSSPTGNDSIFKNTAAGFLTSLGLNMPRQNDMETGRAVKTTGLHTYNVNAVTTDKPTGLDYGSVLVWGNGPLGAGQMAVGWFGDNDKDFLAFRSLRGTAGDWWPWKRIYHEGYKPRLGDLVNDVGFYGPGATMNYPVINGGSVLDVSSSVQANTTTNVFLGQDGAVKLTITGAGTLYVDSGSLGTKMAAMVLTLVNAAAFPFNWGSTHTINWLKADGSGTTVTNFNAAGYTLKTSGEDTILILRKHGVTYAKVLR